MVKGTECWETEILNAARSSPTYHAGVAMATHPVNASYENEKQEKKKGWHFCTGTRWEVKNNVSTLSSLIPHSYGPWARLWEWEHKTCVSGLPVTAILAASSAIRNHISSLQRKCPLYCAARHQQSLFLAQPLLTVRNQHIPTTGVNNHPNLKATRAVQQPNNSSAIPWCTSAGRKSKKRKRAPFTVARCCSYRAASSLGMKPVTICRKVTQDNVYEFKHIEFNRCRHPSHAL